MKRRDVLKEFWLLNVALEQVSQAQDLDEEPSAERHGGLVAAPQPKVEVALSSFENNFRFRRQ
jgi:hypothetical protein